MEWVAWCLYLLISIVSSLMPFRLPVVLIGNMIPIVGSNSTGNIRSPFFHQFKKHASFFLKERIKTARLALTDVTPAEILTEEATDGIEFSPDARTLRLISRAAFEVDDYWRIVEVLHKRLQRFETRNWRSSYKTLIVVEHLLTHGQESAADEFQMDKDVILEMQNFQLVDEKGFNWGIAVRRKSEPILRLLEKGPLLKEERERVPKLAREIQGFGSFNQMSSSSNGSFYRRCNSNFVRSEKTLLSAEKMVELGEEDCLLKSKPFLSEEHSLVEDHPSCEDDNQSATSLLSLCE